MENGNSVFVKVKQGMVFWYNNHEGEDKNEVVVEVNGFKKLSRVIAGKRPWVVVSSDEMNEINYTCNIVPLTTADREDNRFVQFYYNGKLQTVLTNQLTTVDSFVLREYECFLTKKIMRRIQEGLIRQYSVEPEIEEVIKETNKVEEEVKHLEILADINESIEEYRELMIEAKDNISYLEEARVSKEDSEEVQNTELQSAVDRFNKKYEKYFNGKEDKGVVINRPKKDWTVESAKVFLEEYNSGVDKNELVMKYKLKNIGSVYRLKETLEKMVKKNTKVKNDWNEETAREFMQDIETLDRSQVIEKYGFNGPQTIYATKHKLSKRFKL